MWADVFDLSDCPTSFDCVLPTGLYDVWCVCVGCYWTPSHHDPGEVNWNISSYRASTIRHPQCTDVLIVNSPCLVNMWGHLSPILLLCLLSSGEAFQMLNPCVFAGMPVVCKHKTSHQSMYSPLKPQSYSQLSLNPETCHFEQQIIIQLSNKWSRLLHLHIVYTRTHALRLDPVCM